MPNGPQDQISEIFFPHATREANKAREHGIRFVHYSTADTAVKMLKYGEIWMRSASLMNDFMEIEHGWKCVESALKSEAGTRFKQALENVGHGQLAHQLTPGLGQWISSFRHQTFLTCFSEHGELRHVGPDEDPEDRFGRLSMWRAYGGQTGVAIIMKGTSFLTEQSAIDVFLSPVAYLSPQDLAPKMDEITAGVEANADFVRSRDHSEIRQVVFNLLRFAVIATKHPGFKEEREWRLIYSPQFTTPGANSALVTHAIETIRGIPQPIHKVSLAALCKAGLTAFSLPNLIDRVIVGPTQHPVPIFTALVDQLRAAEVPEPERKVFVSEIPLRH